MKQQLLHDELAVRYADAVEHVWERWQPSLDRCEVLLAGDGARDLLAGDELADALRRAQYHAHTASEFAAGLVPPPSAADAHGSLLDALAMCRDALGVLAMRASIDELDDDMAELGLHATGQTRSAFRGARSSTALARAWVEADGVDAPWGGADDRQARGGLLAHVAAWTTCAALGSCAIVLLVDRVA